MKEKNRMNSMAAVRIGLSVVIAMQAVLPPAYGQAPRELHIIVVDGEGVINNVGQRSARDPAVRIADESQKPVAGAAVVFTLPTEGASGEFANGEKTVIVTTDSQGRAAALGLRANTAAGKMVIHVSASFRGQTARTNITEFNMAVPGKRAGGSGKKVAVILALVGAAAAGGLAATTSSKSTASAVAAPPTAPPTPIGIAPGVGTVGPPR